MHYVQGITSSMLTHFISFVTMCCILFICFAEKFRRYDFGELKNLVIYDDMVPPRYNLRNVTAPVSLIYAGNDWLSASFVRISVTVY